jgi:hypothetical protein
VKPTTWSIRDILRNEEKRIVVDDEWWVPVAVSTVEILPSTSFLARGVPKYCVS